MGIETYTKRFTIKERAKIVSETIKSYRNKANYTLQEIADMLEIKMQTYANYERSLTEPPIEILVRLSKIYGVSIDDLVQAETENIGQVEVKEKIESYKKQLDALSDMTTRIPDEQEKEDLEKFFEQMKNLTDTLPTITKYIKKK